MKILMINKFLHPNGGSETYIFRLGKALQEKGHEVQYFGMEHENRCVGNAVNAYTSSMDFHSGRLLDKLTYPVKTIYSGEARRQIRKVLNDFSPDVCHLNNFTYQLTPSILLEIGKWERETGKHCRIVYTAHDYQLVCPNHMCNNPNTHENCEKCLSGRFYHCTLGRCIHGSFPKSIVGTVEAYFWRWQKVYRKIDTIICCSKFIKQKLDMNPLLQNKTKVLYNFMDRPEWHPVEKKKYILYFGRFSEEKGLNTLLQVCRELPNIPFLFAGTGPLEEAISSVPNITNVGFQTGEVLAGLIREARFSICPSEWYENCPFSVMESQVYGTPVLGADIGGIPELIQPGVTGELFRSGDKEDLKQKLLLLWGNERQLEGFYENCCHVHFNTTDEYAEILLPIYREEERYEEQM